MTPEEACYDSKFCSHFKDRKIILKQTHPYYHEVQLQLYVGLDIYSWCNFCIYTCKGFSVQHILPNTEWQKSKILELEDFFDCFMLPELVCPKYKPRYILKSLHYLIL